MYYAEHVHIAQAMMWTQSPNHYCTHFWDGYIHVQIGIRIHVGVNGREHLVN